MALVFSYGGQRSPSDYQLFGGTETSGGLVCGNVLSLLKPCSFSGPVPGIAVDVVDEDGMSVRGQVGELVVRQPWIGITRGFWKDPQRYVQTYWTRFPDVWVHGDWAAVDVDGLWYILGCSDDTIKIAGKRLGPAESSRSRRSSGRDRSRRHRRSRSLKGEALVCFCVLKSASNASETLREELRTRVAEQLGKPLKPEILKFLDDLPKTRNAKIMRRIIRASYLNQDPEIPPALGKSAERAGRAQCNLKVLSRKLNKGFLDRLYRHARESGVSRSF